METEMEIRTREDFIVVGGLAALFLWLFLVLPLAFHG
jgi:hypothetical protein